MADDTAKTVTIDGKPYTKTQLSEALAHDGRQGRHQLAEAVFDLLRIAQEPLKSGR